MSGIPGVAVIVVASHLATTLVKPADAARDANAPAAPMNDPASDDAPACGVSAPLP
jgi:hypothetical protein